MGNQVAKEEKKENITYQPENHFQGLNIMRKLGTLCDIEIQIEGKRLHAHKVVLVGTMRYFEKLFLEDSPEFNSSVVSITEVKYANMEILIEFAYTGQITLSEDNVQSLMKDAHFLDLHNVTNKCAEFLVNCVYPKNAIEIYYLANSLNCTELKKKSLQVLQQHFQYALQTENYLDIDFALLKDILSNNQLQVLPQHKLFETVMKWVVKDADRRKVYLKKLLRFVKFSDITSEYLVNYFFSEDMAPVTNCHEDLLKEVMFSFRQCRNKTLLEIECKNTGNEKGNIVVISSTNSTTMEIFEPRTGIWETTGLIQNPRKWFSCVVHEGRLYIAGGKVISSVVSSALVYEFENKIWKTISAMNSKRCFAKAVALNGYVYVCGGYSGKLYLNSVERYCSETDEWETMQPMNQSRNELGVAVWQQSIFAFGGQNGTEVLDSVERYDDDSNQWTMLDTRMQVKRFDFGVALLKGKLYVCGGCGSSLEALSSVERYDPKSNRWEYVANMKTARMGLLVVAVMGKLWAIGGYDKTSFLSTIEVYDPAANTWSYTPSMSTIEGSVTGGVLQV